MKIHPTSQPTEITQNHKLPKSNGEALWSKESQNLAIAAIWVVPARFDPDIAGGRSQVEK